MYCTNGVRCFRRNLCCFHQSHFRTDRTVGENLDGQLVVVGLLADTSLFHFVSNPSYRAVNGVDRDDADLLDILAMLCGRDIPPAIFHNHFDDELNVFGKGRQYQVLVDDLYRLVAFDVGCRNGPSRILLDAKHLRTFAVVLDDQRLYVEHDVGNVFHHAGDRCEFVLCVVNLDLGNRTAFQAGKQNATQAVADGCTETTLKTARRQTFHKLTSMCCFRRSRYWATQGHAIGYGI